MSRETVQCNFRTTAATRRQIQRYAYVLTELYGQKVTSQMVQEHCLLAGLRLAGAIVTDASPPDTMAEARLREDLGVLEARLRQQEAVMAAEMARLQQGIQRGLAAQARAKALCAELSAPSEVASAQAETPEAAD